MVIWLLAAIGLIVALCAIIYAMHRLLVMLEDRGYIYYRHKSQGGGGGAFIELDKFIRPSMEHVQKAEDRQVEVQNQDGE